MCSELGRRICKADDLKNNKCCLTGCYFDDKLTWQWNSVRPPRPSEEEDDHHPYPEDWNSQEENSPPYRPPRPPNFGTPQAPQKPNRPWRPPGPMDCCHRNPRPRCLTDSSVCREDLEYERYKARKERERQREKCKNHPTNCLTVTGG